MKTELPRDADGSLSSYAWPGGYPILYLMADGYTLCPDCANGGNGSIANEDDEDPQWRIEAYYIYYEGPVEDCAHCGKLTPSAYGDSDDRNRNLDPMSAYTVKIRATDIDTLLWLADRGYDGDFWKLSSLSHYEGPDGMERDADQENDSDTVWVFTLSEPDAWEFQANVNEDPYAFLACNGSETLAEALCGLLNEIA